LITIFHCRNTKKISLTTTLSLSLQSNLGIMAKYGFSERMYLQFLRTKFTTLGMMSPPLAGKLAFNLFCTPYPKFKKRKAPAIFHQANKIQVVVIGDGIHNHGSSILNGFEWLPNKSNGKTVLIVHGYASCAYKFEQYIHPLLNMGCRVLCFDAPGHGLSQGKYINIVNYQQAINEIIKDHGPIDYFIGHSMGAITLSMIAETIENPFKHKFVLIAPATKTVSTFERFFNMMHFSDAVRTAFIVEMGKHTHHPVSYFEADRALQHYTGPLLWVHDEEDMVCPYKDLKDFQNKAPENIKFLITKGLGHNKVYKTQAVIDKIMAFLAS
jgi:pimeloyl-ACP methyl ester carboxylesterase